ncbi:MAG: NACHT domain-containing protein [Microthrixaceae bacterium]
MVPGSAVVAVAARVALLAEEPAPSGLSWGTLLALIGVFGVILAVPAALAQITGYSLKDLVRRPDGTAGGDTIELTGPMRARLLKAVRWRSSGQVQQIVEPTGFLHLQLEPVVELVRRPLDAQPTLVATANIEDAYRSAGGRLLITGDPGGGKTTLLFSLIDHLAKETEADDAAPIPLVLNLSGWTPGTPIREWVVDRLCDRNGGGYGLDDRPLAQALVDTHRFALMLDGLDEVHDKHRSACLDALNELLESLPDAPAAPAPLVITCRTAEYEQIVDRHPHSRLGHMRACTVLPLTEQAVIDNLRELGSRQRDWRQLTGRKGATARAVLRSPLMLSLAAEMADPASLLGKDREAIERAILTTYLDRQLARPDPAYPAGDARRWLAWVAHTLRKSHIDSTTFYLEHLSGRVVPRVLRIGVAVTCGLAGGLAGGLVGGLAGRVGVRVGGRVGVRVGGMERRRCAANPDEVRSPHGVRPCAVARAPALARCCGVHLGCVGLPDARVGDQTGVRVGGRVGLRVGDRVGALGLGRCQ